MTDSSHSSNDALAERLLALQATRSESTAANEVPDRSNASSKPRPTGPAPARIVAAAASVAAGIGLVTLMAGAQQDVVVQVNPTPVTVQPARVIVELAGPGASVDELQVRTVEAAVAAERPAPQAKVVSQSEGS